MRPVADLLNELFRRKGMKRSLRRAEAVLLWPRVVGADVARFSSARTMQDGVLIVDVADSETAMHLSMQRRRFLAVFRDTYGVTDIKDVRFQVGRVRPSAGQTAPTAHETARDRSGASGQANAEDEHAARDTHARDRQADPAELAAMVKELDRLGLDEEVAAATLKAGRSLLGLRAELLARGYVHCPTCGAVHDGPLLPLTPREEELTSLRVDHPDLPDRELCVVCRRAAREPRVLAAARELVHEPSSTHVGLGEDELAVATRLAAAYLDTALDDMLPRALADPNLRPQVVHAASRRAALASGKALADVSDDDVRLLDDRVGRYLNWTLSD